jgi:hypothetical protein
MSNTDRSTVTRRTALQTGTLAAIAAGLLGTTTTPPASAEPAPVSDLVTALCAGAKPAPDDDFAAWLAEWEQANTITKEKRDAAVERIAAFVPEDQRYELVTGVDALEEVLHDSTSLSHALYCELMFRHLPGLAPVLRLVWAHVMDTRTDRLEECGGGYCADGASGPF